MKILKALRSGATISALIDQDTKLESAYAPFFGLDAASPSGLIKLAVRKNIPILSCFIVRSGPDNYQLHSKIIDYDSSSADSLNSIVCRYNQELERVISLYPEQWVWWHKRWRRRPGVDYNANPNELKNSVDYSGWIASISEGNLKTVNKN
jgi:KDO2-lipid IV(A) lauroyltransferase